MRTITALTFVALFVCAFIASAQERLPVRDYVSPEELISMDPSTTFDQAMDIFNNASKRFRFKPVIYDGAVKTPVGIQISHMQWQDAFELVLRANNHWFTEDDDVVRVYELGKTAGGRKDTTGMSAKQAMTTREVQISAVFFEANRSELEQLGLDWILTHSTPSATTGIMMSNSGSQSAVTQKYKDISGTSNSSSSGGSSGGSSQNQVDLGNITTLAVGNATTEFLAALRVFASENLGDLISSPNITVRSGEKGRIQVGQDFSVKQKDFSGNTTERFYSAGTIIEVTPTVITQDSLEFVHLEINAERSTFIPDPTTTIVNKTVATTSVVLIDQEETVIGGLMSNEVKSVRRGVPFLKDLPWWVFGLRYFFGYEEQAVEKRELIIILKAAIVPTIEQRIASKLNEINQGQDALRVENQRLEEQRRSLVRQIHAARESQETQE